MKKTTIYTFAVAALTACFFTACSDEEALEPSGINENYFKVDDNAQDAESVLRRNFYNDNGIYLLFNDTLRNECIGKDAYGDDIWRVETIDLTYNLTSNGATAMRFDYMTDIADKQKAAALVEDLVIPHLAGTLRPYSIFLVNNLAEGDSYGYWDAITCVANMRCLAISVDDWPDMDADGQEAYRKEICKTLVSDRLSGTDDTFDPFYAIGSEYYYEYISDYIPDWDGNVEYIYEYGFLSYYKDRWGEMEYDSFSSYSVDFEDFFNAVMDYTEEDFIGLYGDYPLIMQKYYIMKNAITDLGYIF